MTDVVVRSGGTSRYELASAILLYESRTGMGDRDVYATVHNIERNRRGGPRLAAGQPATAKACEAFARAMTDRAAFAGWIAPEILFVGPRTVAWWRAPAVATMFFETVDEKNARRHIGNRTGRLPQPGLVHMLVEGNWHVYAVKGAARPRPDTPLFRSPHFNVHADGAICEGNVRRPERVSPDTLAQFERAFFHSRFTHPNASDKLLTRYRGGVHALWRDLLDGRHKTFPEASLQPFGKHTLESLLRSFEQKKQ